MSFGSVFENNRTQAIRLPADTRFPSTVKKVSVRVLRHDRIISPVDQSWDSFFYTTDAVSDDFLSERNQPTLEERESL